ncbi:Os04g0504700 [Oryza sativa Japonica Group]|uniref:Os04g0504700 protein n=1 Tax=Oryza sativa subsp. japonica TaxID=39947 RepID=C7J158_ORYSJ|nr:Os04g0504700 [Oryza sativa Japonica Group]|eukprot:NP_001174006.1 Os04g0504700 [Oryza sativa Japonica Group]
MTTASAAPSLGTSGATRRKPRRCTDQQWRKRRGGIPTTWLGRNSRAWRSSRRTTAAAVATPCMATRLPSTAKERRRLRRNAATHQVAKNAAWRMYSGWRRQLQRSQMP